MDKKQENEMETRILERFMEIRFRVYRHPSFPTCNSMCQGVIVCFIQTLRCQCKNLLKEKSTLGDPIGFVGLFWGRLESPLRRIPGSSGGKGRVQGYVLGVWGGVCHNVVFPTYEP